MRSLTLKVMFGLVLALGLTFALSLGAVAQEAEAEDEAQDATEDEVGRPPRKFPKMTRECMFFRTIYDWRALDPYNLIVWFNNRNTPRHIELETACYSARFVDTIAFTSRDNRLCAFGGDSVIIGDMQCSIGALNKLTPDEADALTAKFKERYKKKSKKKDDGD